MLREIFEEDCETEYEQSIDATESGSDNHTRCKPKVSNAKNRVSRNRTVSCSAAEFDKEEGSNGHVSINNNSGNSSPSSSMRLSSPNLRNRIGRNRTLSCGSVENHISDNKRCSSRSFSGSRSNRNSDLYDNKLLEASEHDSEDSETREQIDCFSDTKMSINTDSDAVTFTPESISIDCDSITLNGGNDGYCKSSQDFAMLAQDYPRLSQDYSRRSSQDLANSRLSPSKTLTQSDDELQFDDSEDSDFMDEIDSRLRVSRSLNCILDEKNEESDLDSNPCHVDASPTSNRKSRVNAIQRVVNEESTFYVAENEKFVNSSSEKSGVINKIEHFSDPVNDIKYNRGDKELRYNHFSEKSPTDRNRETYLETSIDDLEPCKKLSVCSDRKVSYSRDYSSISNKIPKTSSENPKTNSIKEEPTTSATNEVKKIYTCLDGTPSGNKSEESLIEAKNSSVLVKTSPSKLAISADDLLLKSSDVHLEGCGGGARNHVGLEPSYHHVSDPNIRCPLTKTPELRKSDDESPWIAMNQNSSSRPFSHPTAGIKLKKSSAGSGLNFTKSASHTEALAKLRPITTAPKSRGSLAHPSKASPTLSLVDINQNSGAKKATGNKYTSLALPGASKCCSIS